MHPQPNMKRREILNLQQGSNPIYEDKRHSHSKPKKGKVNIDN